MKSIISLVGAAVLGGVLVTATQRASKHGGWKKMAANAINTVRDELDDLWWMLSDDEDFDYDNNDEDNDDNEDFDDFEGTCGFYKAYDADKCANGGDKSEGECEGEKGGNPKNYSCLYDETSDDCKGCYIGRGIEAVKRLQEMGVHLKQERLHNGMRNAKHLKEMFTRMQQEGERIYNDVRNSVIIGNEHGGGQAKADGMACDGSRKQDGGDKPEA